MSQPSAPGPEPIKLFQEDRAIIKWPGSGRDKHERTKEIRVLEAISANKQDIIFLAEAIIIGFLGGLVDVVLGTGLAWAIQHIVPQASPAIYIEALTTLFLVILGLVFPCAVGG